MQRLRQLPQPARKLSTARSRRRSSLLRPARSQQKSGFAFGLNHIVEVLTGADTEAIRQRGHGELSTYGIGKELKRDAWQAVGRELLRMGLLEVAPGKFATLQVTGSGRDALRARTADHAHEATRESRRALTPAGGRDRMRRSSLR